MASYELNPELGDFSEESSEFDLELLDFSEYTPISKIESISFYNIIGVLTDFDGNIKIDQECRFKLMDSGSSVKINYYHDYNQIHRPSFSQEYQVIIIRNIIFTIDKNGSLVGLLNQNSWYKILSNNDTNKNSEIAKLVSKVKEIHKPNSLISSENIEGHQAAKKIKYTEYIEPEQHTITSTSQNQHVLENNLVASSRNALNEISNSISSAVLNSLADARPFNTYIIIAQVVKLEQTYPNRNQYIITDYSSSDKFRNTNIILPNSKLLSGKYFANLTAWDDQRDNIELFKFYRFSIVRAKLDKMGNIEFCISGTKSNVDSSITTLLYINQMECSVIKERMITAIESDTDKSTSPVSSEAIRKSRFYLVKDLLVNMYCDMALLVLKKIDIIESENLILICTDFTSNPLLRNSLPIEYNKITVDSNMVIRLLINGNARLAINEIFKKNPYILILQLLNLRVGVSDAYGAELVLRSNAAVKITNNKPVLSFDPIAKKDSSYYKMLIKRYDDLFKQFNRGVSSSITPGARPMTEEEPDTEEFI